MDLLEKKNKILNSQVVLSNREFKDRTLDYSYNLVTDERINFTFNLEKFLKGKFTHCIENLFLNLELKFIISEILNL